MAVEVKYPNLIYNSFQKGESRMNLIHCDIDYINVVIIFDREVKDCVAPVKIKEILGTEGDVISLPDILLAEKRLRFSSSDKGKHNDHVYTRY